MMETLLKESEKSIITLLEDDAGRKLVRKELAGAHETYHLLKDISHPYLPQIHSVEIGAERTIVTEEYISGRSIGALKLTEQQAIGVILELCEVLAFLHQRGILHRDIKPSNILMGNDGHIRLIDFDAARTMKADGESDTRQLGTRGFAPPEQYGFAQTDQRADIYAVGVTMEALLGEAARKPALQKVIRRCTAIDPAKRYRRVEQIPKALKGKRQASFVVPLVCMLAIAVIVLAFAWRSHQTAPPPENEVTPPAQQLEAEPVPPQTPEPEADASVTDRTAASSYLRKPVQALIDDFGDALVFAEETWSGARFLFLNGTQPLTAYPDAVFFISAETETVTGSEIIQAVGLGADIMDVLPGLPYNITQNEIVTALAGLPYYELSSSTEDPNSDFQGCVHFYIDDMEIFYNYLTADPTEFPVEVLLKPWYFNETCDALMAAYAQENGIADFVRSGSTSINDSGVEYLVHENGAFTGLSYNVSRTTGEVFALP